MIWQFGEQGYDISIDYPCRVCNKPILWHYLQENSRKRLFDVYKAIINLRKNHDVFTGDDFTYSLNQAVKTLKLNDPNMNAVVLANFDVNEKDKQFTFQNNGWWYEYFSGDSINVTSNYNFSLGPGEYRLYTDTKLSLPNILNTLSTNDYEIANWEVEIYPNPSSNILNVNVKDFRKSRNKIHYN